LRGQATKTRAKNGLHGRTAANGRCCCALIDGLTFHLVGPPDRKRCDVQLIEERFRAAFVRTWGRIPAQDRRTLLRYWHDRPDPGLPLGTGPRPAICVLVSDSCGRPPFVCDGLGHELTFAVDPADEQADGLPLLIARGLSQVWMYATKRHWD